MILTNHLDRCRIFDVLAPLSYDSPAEYRAGWDEWQPEATKDAVFELFDLQVEEGEDVGFAHGFIRCGGSLPDGGRYDDVVRATFCFRKLDGRWLIAHQHISMPKE